MTEWNNKSKLSMEIWDIVQHIYAYGLYQKKKSALIMFIKSKIIQINAIKLDIWKKPLSIGKYFSFAVLLLH